MRPCRQLTLHLTARLRGRQQAIGLQDDVAVHMMVEYTDGWAEY
jgi:hypothetical protein